MPDQNRLRANCRRIERGSRTNVCVDGERLSLPVLDVTRNRDLFQEWQEPADTHAESRLFAGERGVESEESDIGNEFRAMKKQPRVVAPESRRIANLVSLFFVELFHFPLVQNDV